MTGYLHTARLTRSILRTSPLALVLAVCTPGAAEEARCIEPASLPDVPAAAIIGEDAGENVRNLRRSLDEWRSYRLLLLERLEAECARPAPALSARSDCEVVPLEDAWNDLQLSGNDVEDSMQIAAELRYVKLSAADLRIRFVPCAAPVPKGG